MSSIHEGRNVKRFRESLGLPQTILAEVLGMDWNTEAVELLESSAMIEIPILQKISVALNIPVAAFQNFNEEQSMNIVSNTFNEGSIAYARAENIQCTSDPADKLIELYERMLQEKEAVIRKLEQRMKRP
ncbi:MAG: hypothetical protein BGO31_05040 [Bacteroidetes bacterium 43-16]|nr:MAG: hypothetical protein BGO31_05040 [Bacteroidetes bacterium 43-16]